MAQIININRDKPMKGERYFVDTNVWFWFTYVASKDIALPDQPKEYQLNDYPRFIEDVLNNGSTLCHCPLTFTELSNIIEYTELKIYRSVSGNEHCTKKEFREIDDSRKDVLKEIDMAWSSINEISECVEINIDKKLTDDSFTVMSNSKLDPFDAFYAQIMTNNRIDCIITDDHDFCTYNKHIVVTGNQKALR